MFRERGKINAEVTGRLTESLGGVRVIKGYHAEEREAGAFSAGVDRLLENVMKSLTMTSVLSSASTSVLGLVSALVMWLGGHNVLTHTGPWATTSLQHVSRLYDCTGLSDGEYRHAVDRSLCRTRPHQRAHGENWKRTDAPDRTEKMPPIHGTVRFEDVGSPTMPTSRCCTASVSTPSPER